MLAKIKTICLRNILSWKLASVDLHPGLNVIVGPSDSGKSNLYRALRAVVENAPAARIVSVGESEGSASVAFDDGSMVTLSKGVGKKAENAYAVAVPGSNVATYRQVGQECPAPVAAELRLGPVALSGIEVDLHFAPQRGDAFGVDTRPADLARIVGAVSGLDVVYAALSEAELGRKRTATAESDARARHAEAVESYRAVMAVLPAAEVERIRDEAVAVGEDIKAEEARATALRNLADEVELAGSTVDKLSTRLAAIDEAVGSLQEVATAWGAASTDANAYRSLADRIDEAKDEVDRLYGVFKDEDVALELAEAEVRELVKVKCPVCGRKGKP